MRKKMKAHKSIFIAALILASVVAHATAAPSDSITVVDTRYNNLFVFKADRELKGALVEVYHANGDLVISHTLLKRKMVIDFCDVRFGSYTIKITKNGNTQEFTFDKKLILSEVIR